MLKMYQDSAHAGGSADHWEAAWSDGRLEQALRFCDVDPLRPLFEAYVPPGARLLEGGCGRGQYVVYYSHRGRQVVGLDFAQKALGELRARRADLLLTAGDVASLPFRTSSFDAYYSGGVVEHFEEGCLPALREARRVLRRDGVLLVSVPYLGPLRRVACRWRSDRRLVAAEGRDDDQAGRTFFQYAYTRPEFIGLLRQAGFRVVATKGYSILWGLLEMPLIGALVARLQREPRKGSTAPSHASSSAPSHRPPPSLARRLAAMEDDSVPFAGVAVKALRWFGANMMMYVCIADAR